MNENKYVINNLSNYECQFGDQRDGNLKNYDFGSGATCSVYIPENVNSNTTITVYYPGSGFKTDMYNIYSNGRLGSQDYLMQNGSDNIVIMPDVGAGNNNNRVVLGAEMIEQIQKEYNLQNTSVEYSGFSLGADACLKTAVQNIKNNPDIEPQICVTVDGFSNFYYHPQTIISEIKDTFIENGTILIGLEAKNKADVLDDYVKAGINVLRVQYDGDGQNQYIGKNGEIYTKNGMIHTAINQHFFKDGFSDFAAGKISLPTQGYTYQYFDLNSNKWVNIDVSQINTYDKLNAFFGNNTFELRLNKLLSLSDISLNNLSIKSDSAILSQPLNQIIGKIKNSSYLQSSNLSSASFSSTSQMPSKVPEVVKEYFVATIDLLYKISNDVNEFAKIGPLIDKIDRDLSNQAVQALQLNPNNTTSESTLLNTNLTNNEVNNDKEKNTEETLTVPITPNLNNDSQFTTLAGTTGAIGMAAGAANTIKKEQVSTDDAKNIITPSGNQTSNRPVNQPDNGIIKPINKPLAPQTAPSNNQANSGVNPINNNETHPLEQFPKYEEVYSDETKIVYNCNDEYKVIIHKDGDKIIGIEHYYDFGSESSANQALNNIKLDYQNTEHMENIMQQGRYVKVVFSEEMYSNLTINQIKEKYSNLNEIIKI